MHAGFKYPNEYESLLESNSNNHSSLDTWFVADHINVILYYKIKFNHKHWLATLSFISQNSKLRK